MSRTTVSTLLKAKPAGSKSPKSYRVQHRFWLDVYRSQEYDLDQEIAKMKENRTFASTMRDALRLIIDLRGGKLDVLRELFPWVDNELKTAVATPAPVTASDEFNEIMKELRRLQQKIGQVQPANLAPVFPSISFPAIDAEADTRPTQTVAQVENQSRQNFAASMGDLFGDDEPV